MRCLICENFSFSIICKNCQKVILKPNIQKRRVIEDFYAISFYGYSDIENLLKTKHTFIGSFIYNILAKNSFYQFAKSFMSESKIFIIPVDDRVKDSYSHTAVLAKNLKQKKIKPIYNSLIAKNRVSFSSKSLEYRLKNPREFEYLGPENKDVIIVDDIITTGQTLKEAYYTIKDRANPIFALVLADARN